VCLPKWTLQKVIADLEDGDLAKQELLLMQEQSALQSDYITIQDSLISEFTNSLRSCEDSRGAALELIDIQENQIDKMEKKLKNNKRLGGVILAALLVGLIIK